jgi:PAS domain S-box-containing protein
VERAWLEKIDALRSRIESLRLQVDEHALLDRAGALEQLQQSLAELQTAHEELRVQGEELGVTRQQLETERQRYRDLFEYAPEGYIVTDAEGVIRDANRAIAEMLGVQAWFLVGKPLAAFVQDADLRAFRAELNALRQSGARSGEAESSPMLNMELRLRPRGGEPMEVLISYIGVPDATGEIRAIRWMLRDVSVQKCAERQIRELNESLERRVAERTVELERANRTKDRFLAMLSHELRTPLTPALAAASELAHSAALPAEAREEAEIIRRNIELETRLIDDLLDITRIAHAKMAIHPAITDLHDVLAAAMDICRSEANFKQHRLALELRAPGHHVCGDAARLQQIFWNLIRNAIKFTPPRGDIRIATFNPPDGSIAVEVCDSGVGFDSDILPRLFNPFEQGETAVTRRFGGLGLGLALAKTLVEAHGGHLGAVSPGHDRGSTFTVTFPTCAPRDRPDGHPDDRASQASGERGATHAPTAASPLRILLVEDHPDTARVMARVLAAEGHHVETAHTALRALELAANEPFDLLISDLGLPDASGNELVGRIQQIQPLASIALSGFGTADDISASRAAGFAAHLTKPVDLARLRAEIHRVRSTTPSHREVDDRESN